MSDDVPFELVLKVGIHLLTQEEGGCTTPVSSGYRPLCRFHPLDGTPQTVGMCQLEVVDVAQVKPGESTRAVPKFAPALTELVRKLAELGTEIELMEGTHVVGTAYVTAIQLLG